MSISPPAPRRPYQAAAPPKRLPRLSDSQTRLRPTSFDNPSSPANPLRPTQFHAADRDIFQRQSLHPPSSPAPALALPSVSPRISASSHTSLVSPNTSLSAPAMKPSSSAPAPPALSRSQTPNPPRSLAPNSQRFSAAPKSAVAAFPIQSSF